MQRTLSCPYLLGRTRPSREACAFAGAESSCSRRYLSPNEAVPRCPRPAWPGRGDGLGLGSSVHVRGGAPGRGHAVGPGPAASHLPPGLLGSWTKVPRCCSWFLWEVAGSSPLGSLQTQPVCLPALDSPGVSPAASSGRDLAVQALSSPFPRTRGCPPLVQCRSTETAHELPLSKC